MTHEMTDNTSIRRECELQVEASTGASSLVRVMKAVKRNR
jgi:hypothetical protein